jgi:hypothetical protein
MFHSTHTRRGAFGLPDASDLGSTKSSHLLHLVRRRQQLDVNRKKQTQSFDPNYGMNHKFFYSIKFIHIHFFPQRYSFLVGTSRKKTAKNAINYCDNQCFQIDVLFLCLASSLIPTVCVCVSDCVIESYSLSNLSLQHG